MKDGRDGDNMKGPMRIIGGNPLYGKKTVEYHEETPKEKKVKYNIKWIRMMPVWAYGSIEVDDKLTSEELDKIWSWVTENPEAYFKHQTFINGGDVPDYQYTDKVDENLFIEFEGKWEDFDSIINKLEKLEKGVMSIDIRSVNAALIRLNEMNFPVTVKSSFGMRSKHYICENESELKDAIQNQLMNSYIGLVNLEWDIKVES